VASRLQGVAVQYVRIASEQGQPVTLGNPCAAKAARLYRNGIDRGTLNGPEVMFPTAKGQVVTLVPDGTTCADVMSRL
jgi:hypothetical protein